MATYLGQMIAWDEALNSELVVPPVDKYTGFDDTLPVVPDEHGRYEIPMPGLTSTA